MKSIEVVIGVDATVTVEACGFKGQACDLATKAFEEAMGQVTKKAKKPSYYQQETGKQSVGGGR